MSEQKTVPLATDPTMRQVLYGHAKPGIGRRQAETKRVQALEQENKELADKTKALTEGLKVAVSEFQKTVEESYKSAEVDSLTGLANRGKILEEVHKQYAQAERKSEISRLAIAMIDLDKFKEINDTMGHSAGDQVLKEFGRRLKSHTRSGETAGRPGGDEFLIIADIDPTEEHMQAFGQRLCSLFTEPIVVDGRPIHLTGSIGIAFQPTLEEIHTSLQSKDDEETSFKNHPQIMRADKAMYVAKEAGKRQGGSCSGVCLSYQDPQGPSGSFLSRCFVPHA